MPRGGRGGCEPRGRGHCHRGGPMRGRGRGFCRGGLGQHVFVMKNGEKLDP